MEIIMTLGLSIESIIEKFFDNNQLSKISVPILQPADPFLDMAGEDLRRRIFMTENENGDSLCLRPEFTIPVCMAHIAAHSKAPCQYAYIGEVFRQKRSHNRSFIQAGVEDFGDQNEAIADARSMGHALEILHTVSNHLNPKITLGDQTVFAAVLEALGLPQGWQKKLLRAFGQNEKLHQIMTDLSINKTLPKLSSQVEQLLDICDENALTQYIEQEMHDADISPSSGRTPKEIAQRLLEKQQFASVHLQQKTLKALQAFLDIKVPLDKAEAALIAFGQDHNLNIGKALASFQARNQSFIQAGLNLADIFYDAAFGRPLDYYTGLVYEIKCENETIVGGGRYNRLLTMLGAKTPIPAVGFSIWLDRLNTIIAPNGERKI